MGDISTLSIIARQKGIEGKLSYSKRNNKRFAIKLNNGKVINFGDTQKQTYFDHGDVVRRLRFHQRFRNNKGYNDPNSGLYYSARLLW